MWTGHATVRNAIDVADSGFFNDVSRWDYWTCSRHNTATGPNTCVQVYNYV